MSNHTQNNLLSKPAKLAKRFGPVSLRNEIQRVRVLFTFAYDTDLIDGLIK